MLLYSQTDRYCNKVLNQRPFSAPLCDNTILPFKERRLTVAFGVGGGANGHHVGLRRRSPRTHVVDIISLNFDPQPSINKTIDTWSASHKQRRY
jgi:hypothetical protein